MCSCPGSESTHGRESGEAGEVECSGRGEVEDSTRNRQLEKEQSWENKACGKDFSCESVEEGTAEMTWDGYGGTSVGGQRATDYPVNSEESGYSSLKDKQVGSQLQRGCKILEATPGRSLSQDPIV